MKIILEKTLNEKQEKVYKVKKIIGVLSREKLPYRYLHSLPHCYFDKERRLIDFYFEEQRVNTYTTDSFWFREGGIYSPQEVEFVVNMLKQCKEKLRTVYMELERDKREWCGEEERII